MMVLIFSWGCTYSDWHHCWYWLFWLPYTLQSGGWRQYINWGHFLLQLPSEIWSGEGNTRWHSCPSHLNIEWLVSSPGVCTHTLPVVSSTWRVCTQTHIAVSSVSVWTPTCCGLCHWFRAHTQEGTCHHESGTHTPMETVISCAGPHLLNWWLTIFWVIWRSLCRK